MPEEERQPWKKCKKCGTLFFSEWIVRCYFCLNITDQEPSMGDTVKANFDIVCLSTEEVVEAACEGTNFATVQPEPFYGYMERIKAARAAKKEPVLV